MTMPTITRDAITANLAALATLLRDAWALATEAYDAMEAGQQNQAVGTILPAEEMLQTADALYKAIISLHKIPR